jgi:hypothetical protein
MVHKMTDGGSRSDGALLHSFQAAGFRRVTFRDGYDYGRYYTLKPEDEGNAGEIGLRQYGLDKPLKLE